VLHFFGLKKINPSFLFDLLLNSPFPSLAHAGLKQIKAYKEAYPEEKPKCAACHVDERPKKADGEYELNDYGKKVQSIKAGPMRCLQADGQSPGGQVLKITTHRCAFFGIYFFSGGIPAFIFPALRNGQNMTGIGKAFKRKFRGR